MAGQGYSQSYVQILRILNTKNHSITNKGIAEDISFNLGFFLYMYKNSRILNLKSADTLSEILKFEFATIVSQTNRCSPIDEKGGLDNILPVR